MYCTQFSEETAHKIWNILMAICGASEINRTMFVNIASGAGISEYRFNNSFGFGVKFCGSSCQVSCCLEDDIPERNEMIRLANEELKPLRRAINRNLYNNYKTVLLNTIDVAHKNNLEPARLLQSVLERMKYENKILSYSFVGNNSIAKIEISFSKWSINATFELKLGHKQKIMNWQMIGF